MKHFAILITTLTACATFAQSPAPMPPQTAAPAMMPPQVDPMPPVPSIPAPTVPAVDNPAPVTPAPTPPPAVDTAATELKDGADQQAQTVENPLLKNLFEKNPFGDGFAGAKSGGEEVAALPEPPKGLELRGIYCVDGKWFFSVADTKLKSYYTIRLGAQKNDKIPYTIDFFDDETNSVSISNDLGTYTLSLKEQDKPTGAVPNMVSAAINRNQPMIMHAQQINAVPQTQPQYQQPQQQQQIQAYMARRAQNNQNANYQNAANQGAVNNQVDAASIKTRNRAR